MQLNYFNSKEDYLAVYYYNTSNNEYQIKSRRNVRLMVSIVFFLVGVSILVIFSDFIAAIFPIAFSAYFYFSYPGKYKSRVIKSIKGSLEEMFLGAPDNIPIELNLEANGLVMLTNGHDQYTTDYKSLRKITETKNYFLINVFLNNYLIIPKKDIDTDAVRKQLEEISTKHHTYFKKDLNWSMA